MKPAVAARTTRIEDRFAALAAQGRAGLVTFVTAGDPDPQTSAAILAALAPAGADIIELGMPFSDPMADGPAVQASSRRALKAGQTLAKTLDLVRGLRVADETTPVVLMGYFNPIYVYGVERFLADARAAAVDGLIVVDLPPEEDVELCLPALRAGLNFIRLATPTTDAKRLGVVLENTAGFVYYVSITGITGMAAPDPDRVREAVSRIKQHTPLPVAVGFGVKTAADAGRIAAAADAVVIGSALVETVREHLDPDGRATQQTVAAVRDKVAMFAAAVRGRTRAATAARGPQTLSGDRL